MKLDLDDIELKARAEIEALANAPRSLGGEPLITTEVADAAWAHHQATSPQVVLALIARIRELEAGQAQIARVFTGDVAAARVITAATAFVDEQGKYVHEGELDARRYFAGDEFGALVKALEGAGL